MKDISEKENAIFLLKSFIIAMNEWEQHEPLLRDAIFNNGDVDSLKRKMKEELDYIYNEFCTKKERKYGRQTSLDCGSPPDYSSDEEILKVEEVKGNKLEVYTKQNIGVRNDFRYTLHYKKNQMVHR